jgi:hypothetical protein
VREVIRRGAEDEAKHYKWAVESLEKLGAGRHHRPRPEWSR